jgi:Sulfotransferase family
MPVDNKSRRPDSSRHPAAGVGGRHAPSAGQAQEHAVSTQVPAYLERRSVAKVEVARTVHRAGKPVQETKRTKPFANTTAGRTLYHEALAAEARILARLQPTLGRDVRAPIFIVGSGRSGTTLLGRIFSFHPEVKYLFEPNHLWAAIEPATDFLQIFARGHHHCLLDAGAVTPTARRRFSRLLASPPGRTLVEKNPINVLRIGYINALAPDARFVHIIRDGIDVARSIEKKSAVTKRIAFRPLVNEWWGAGETKWMALRRDGKAAGYYSDQVDQLTTSVQRGAYEWLLSVREAERWRASLGSRLSTVRYQDLSEDPNTALRGLTVSVGLSCPEPWLSEAAGLVRAPGDRQGNPVALPGQMCADFNEFQRSFGFAGRATELS